MKIFKLFLLIAFFYLLNHTVSAQDTIHNWDAKWISHPTANITNFGVFHFRKVFDLSEKPATFIIHISADNRYRLYVNSIPVAFGPARGDLSHWRYETIDIAPYLQKGNNIIAVRVHNEGADKPMAQVTSKTAFILMADTPNGQLVNTGIAPWKVIQNNAYSQLNSSNDLQWWNWAHGWYAIGGTDKVNGSAFPWGWETLDYNDSAWLIPKILDSADSIKWILEPRTIPMMEETTEQFSKIARAEGITASNGFLNATASLAIPANSKVTLLLDMSHETIGYPELMVSRGNKSQIKITYAEALFNSQGKKENRNNIVGNTIAGYWDIFIADGGINRLFRPLWMRTFRFLQLDITTASDTLFLDDLHNVFTAYPFERKASFVSSDTSLQAIWDVSWHTLRLCAAETNFDCPYYEQLNYEGDTRIQSMVALYTSGDDRLMRDAIGQFYNSIRPGREIPQGAYPSTWAGPDYFILPVYSLYFIGIVHDYFMNRKDDAFINQYIPAIKKILEDFNQRIDNSGMLGHRLFNNDWNFVDWAFNNGTPDGGDTGNSALLSFEYLKAIQEANKIFTYFGYTDDLLLWQARADELKKAVTSLCYDETNNLFAETPSRNSYSQHTNILAILTDAVDSSLQPALMNKVIAGDNMTHCSLYYKYYLFRALSKTGLGDQYVSLLGKWKEMLDFGLTTFAEMEDLTTTRSDCHAWSASPAYDFLATTAGIQSAEPGFKTIQIAPAFGNLSYIHAQMPHPKGIIDVNLVKNSDESVTGSIILPPGLIGTYFYKGLTASLNEGTNVIANLINEVKIQSAVNSMNPADILLYPNPAFQSFNIVFKEKCDNPELYLYDQLGRVVIQKELPNTTSTISIGQLAAGNYICKIVSNGMVIKRNILVKLPSSQ